jgi:hypothetical protein
MFRTAMACLPGRDRVDRAVRGVLQEVITDEDRLADGSETKIEEGTVVGMVDDARVGSRGVREIQDTAPEADSAVAATEIKGTVGEVTQGRLDGNVTLAMACEVVPLLLRETTSDPGRGAGARRGIDDDPLPPIVPLRLLDVDDPPRPEGDPPHRVDATDQSHLPCGPAVGKIP